MKDWLDHCQRNHTKCKNTPKGFVPTRLLDIEAFKRGEAPNLGDDVKLVCLDSNEFRCDETPSYITLSHCWGPPSNRPVTTTETNLSERMSRISFSGLPKTFQDAVEIARKLGQRYLWIDSLCIIQDSEQDWAREASLMAKVYAYAYCTLAALSSKDGSEGLQQFDIQHEDHTFVDIAATATDRVGCYRILSKYPPRWSTTYDGLVRDRAPVQVNDNSPLRFRAWALQERELSRRTIYFSNRELLWECRELKGTAQLPWQESRFTRYSAHLQCSPWEELDQWTYLQDTPKTTDLAAVVLEEHRLEQHWWRMVVDYSFRCLTQETDMLIALSGVAQAYKEECCPSGTYAAGLWREHLPEGLLWRVDADHKKARTGRRLATTEYVAPSWSWASVKAEVFYDPGTYLDRFNKMMNRLGQKCPPLPQTPERDVSGRRFARMRPLDWHDPRAVAERFEIRTREWWSKSSLVKKQKQRRKDRNRRLADQILYELKVEEMRVQPKHGDAYGALRDAVLVLGGARLVRVDYFPDPKKLDGEEGIGSMELTKNGVQVARALPDAILGGMDALEMCGGVLMCLGIRKERDFEDTGDILDWMEGILLREIHEEDGTVTYRRVGYMHGMDASLFKRVKPRTIILK